jgi:hypothetical protein
VARDSEKYLLIAARNALRSALGLRDDQCTVELDELAIPATAGDKYVAVAPFGVQRGPNHNASGGVRDLLYGISVIVVIRLGKVPRDRRRDAFLDNLGGLSELVDSALTAVDWSYEINQAANARILEETGVEQGFIEPLRFVGMDSRPQIVGAEIFGAEPETGVAGMKRAVHFSGARRITYT